MKPNGKHPASTSLLAADHNHREREPGWWRSDALTAMEPLIPERLAQPFPGSYWAGRQPEDSGKLVTLLVPAQIRNFHHDTYANNCGTWWLAIEDREIWLAIAASALAE